MYNHSELAWAAGFFDGEGSIHLTCTKRQGKVWGYPHATLTQVDSRPSERFVQAVGVGRVDGPYPRPSLRPNEQPIHRVYYQSWKQTQQVLAILWSYLSEPKKEQARQVFDQWRQLERFTGTHQRNVVD